MAQQIQVLYDEMAQVSNRFSRQTEQVEQQKTRLSQAVETLRNGGWQGQDANRFYTEFDGEVEPAIRRLIQALAEASAVTQRIAQAMQQAEEEASAIFPK